MNTEIHTKKSIQTQTQKMTKSPVTKFLQILPRGTQETSTTKIVDITSTETQTKIVTQTIPNKRIQNKLLKHIEFPNAEKEDKDTHTTFSKEYLI